MKTQNFRSRVFKEAYLLVLRSDVSFSKALKGAWELYRLRKKLRTSKISDFDFLKLDGSLRHAKATLHPSIINDKVQGKRNSYLGVLTYYDLEKQSFRCARIERVIRDSRLAKRKSIFNNRVIDYLRIKYLKAKDTLLKRIATIIATQELKKQTI